MSRATDGWQCAGLQGLQLQAWLCVDALVATRSGLGLWPVDAPMPPDPAAAQPAAEPLSGAAFDTHWLVWWPAFDALAGDQVRLQRWDAGDDTHWQVGLHLRRHDNPNLEATPARMALCLRLPPPRPQTRTLTIDFSGTLHRHPDVDTPMPSWRRSLQRALVP